MYYMYMYLHFSTKKNHCMLHPPRQHNLLTHLIYQEAELPGPVINGVRGKSVPQPCLDLVNGISMD